MDYTCRLLLRPCARSLGFADVGELGDLDRHSEMDGEANLNTLMITVDWGCGRHFRAVRYLKPYVICTAHPHEGSGAVCKEVAVPGGESVERGESIDRDVIL